MLMMDSRGGTEFANVGCVFYILQLTFYQYPAAILSLGEEGSSNWGFPYFLLSLAGSTWSSTSSLCNMDGVV